MSDEYLEKLAKMDNIEIISRDEFLSDLNKLRELFLGESKEDLDEDKKSSAVKNEFLFAFVRMTNYVSNEILDERNRDLKLSDSAKIYTQYKRLLVMIDALDDIFHETESIMAIEDTLENWRQLDDVPEDVMKNEEKDLQDAKKSLEKMLEDYKKMFDPDFTPEWKEIPEIELPPDFLK